MEDIIVTTHLRNAAGVCALSIGLLVCNSGGAIALADQTDAGGAATGTPGVTTTGDDTATATSTSTGPTSTVGNQSTEDNSVEGTTTTGSTTTSLSTGPTTIGLPNGPTSTFEAQTNTSTPSEEDPDLAVAALDLGEVELGLTPNLVVETPVTQAFTPAPFVFTPPSGSNSAPEVPTPAGNEGSFAPFGGVNQTTFATGQSGLEPDPIANAIVVPFANAGALLAQAFGQAGYTLANLPNSKTPLTDVIMSLAMVAGGVVGAVVEVARVPGNLVTLLTGAPGGVPSTLIGGSAAETTIRIPVDVSLGHEVSQSPLAVVTADAPLFGSVIRASNPAGILTTSVKNDLTLSGLAPVPSGVDSATNSFLDNMVSSILVPASLTALAAIAVPGIGGLLIVCAAGVRVGYRQAKAGLALRASGIARFAGPGPMGVVRSGSLIALHTRTSKVGKTHTAPAVHAQPAAGPRLLESVA